MKKNIISMQPPNCDIQMLFLGNLYWTFIDIRWFIVWIKTIRSSLPKDHDCEIFTECFGEIYLGNNISADGLFITSNIRIGCQIYASESEGLLYTILS